MPAALSSTARVRITVEGLPCATHEYDQLLNERELHARYEVMLEQYNKTINVEGQLMCPNNPIGTVDLLLGLHHGQAGAYRDGRGFSTAGPRKG